MKLTKLIETLTVFAFAAFAFALVGCTETTEETTEETAEAAEEVTEAPEPAPKEEAPKPAPKEEAPKPAPKEEAPKPAPKKEAPKPAPKAKAKSAAKKAAAPSTKIVIRGSDTLGAKMVPQLSEAYKEAGNTVSFEIAAEGSSTAFTNLLAGTADIGMSSRNIKDSEVDEFTAKGMEIKDWIGAYDMIGVIVNEANGIENITLAQVEGIFTGDITDWSEVGGKAGPISVYTRNTSSGTYKSFQEMAMNKRDYGADTQKMAGNEQIAAEVAKNESGFCFVGTATTEKEGIKAIAVDGVALEPKNAADYPIARSLHYYTIEGKLSDAAKAFLEWATTDAKAGEVVSRVGFIPAN